MIGKSIWSSAKKELSKILVKSTSYKKRKIETKLQKNLQDEYIKNFETIILNN